MKIQKLVLTSAILLTLLFTSCKPEVETKTYLVTFEDVDLGETGYWNGSDLSGEEKEEDGYLPGTKIKVYYGGFKSGECFFSNKYIKDWVSWGGFACSNKIDTETQGFKNEGSTIAGKGANNSQKFALVYAGKPVIDSPKNSFGYLKASSMMITNSTYAYYVLRDGNNYSKKFGADDWFKVTIKGYKGEAETGSVDYYMADFRNGKTFISKEWEKVNLTSLGEIDRLTFLFDSSDKGAYGINTPTYVCIDNIEFYQEIEK